MKRIGVLSDTHLYSDPQPLPEKMTDDFKNVDLILHAGDITSLDIIDYLGTLAEIIAVKGNMDSPQVKEALPEKRMINVEGVTIGLIHGYGFPVNLIDKVRKDFPKNINAIVFGHSHAAVNRTVDGILFFNPGSPTDKVFAKFNSYGILTVDGGIRGEIIRI